MATDVKRIGSLEVDPIANSQQIMKNKQFYYFMQDINKNGLQMSIITRNGAIIDGRHRALACLQLGIEPTIEEKGDISDEEAYSIVYSHQLRKNDTETQKQIKAYDMWIRTKKSREQIKEITGVGKDILTYCKNIFDEHPQYREPLLNGKGIVIKDLFDDRDKTYVQITPLAKVLKANKKVGPKTVDLDEHEKYDGPDITEILFQEDDRAKFWEKVKDSISFTMFSIEMFEHIDYLNCKFLEKRPAVFSQLPQELLETHLNEDDWKYINFFTKNHSDAYSFKKKDLLIKNIARKKVLAEMAKDD